MRDAGSFLHVWQSQFQLEQGKNMLKKNQEEPKREDREYVSETAL